MEGAARDNVRAALRNEVLDARLHTPPWPRYHPLLLPTRRWQEQWKAGAACNSSTQPVALMADLLVPDP